MARERKREVERIEGRSGKKVERRENVREKRENRRRRVKHLKWPLCVNGQHGRPLNFILEVNFAQTENVTKLLFLC